MIGARAELEPTISGPVSSSDDVDDDDDDGGALKASGGEGVDLESGVPGGMNGTGGDVGVDDEDEDEERVGLMARGQRTAGTVGQELSGAVSNA